MYPYLVASLPRIVLGDPPPQTPEEFLFQAQATLAPEPFAELGRIVADRTAECTTEFGRRWHSLSNQIQNTVARFRADKLEIDVQPYLRPQPEYNLAVDQAVTDAMNLAQPLERTLALDRCRWDVLDELTATDPWGLAAVLAFAVKLRIMGRWARLDEKTGMDRVESFISYNVDKSIELHRVGTS